MNKLAWLIGVVVLALWCVCGYVSVSEYSEAAERSSKWHAVRDAYFAEHSACEACGISGADADLEVHHILDFRLYPERELDADNLITLCNKHCCHMMIGHLGYHKAFNPCVREDAARHLAEIKARPYTKEDAAKFRKRFSGEYQTAP